MNKRIKELAVEAGWHDDKQFATWNKIQQWQDFDKEKFAELIVVECAGLLEKEAESSHDEGTDTYNILLKESNWMKRYFGVEE